MTCNTSAVAVSRCSAPSRSALHSASWRSRSAMFCRRSANVLPEVELICDLVGPCSLPDHTCINPGLHRVVQQRQTTSVRPRVVASRSGDKSARLRSDLGVYEVLRMAEQYAYRPGRNAQQAAV